MKETLTMLQVIALTFGGLIIQCGIFQNLVPLGYPLPNMTLLVVVYLGLRNFSIFSVFCAFVCGLMTDMFVVLGLGPWAGAYVLVYGVVAVFLHGSFRESAGTLALLAFFMSGLSRMVHELLLWGTVPLKLENSVWQYILGEALLSGLAVIILLRIWKAKSSLRFGLSTIGRKRTSGATYVEPKL